VDEAFRQSQETLVQKDTQLAELRSDWVKAREPDFAPLRPIARGDQSLNGDESQRQ
jgi:hypothetical protein